MVKDFKRRETARVGAYLSGIYIYIYIFAQGCDPGRIPFQMQEKQAMREPDAAEPRNNRV